MQSFFNREKVERVLWHADTHTHIQRETHTHTPRGQGREMRLWESTEQWLLLDRPWFWNGQVLQTRAAEEQNRGGVKSYVELMAACPQSVTVFGTIVSHVSWHKMSLIFFPPLSCRGPGRFHLSVLRLNSTHLETNTTLSTSANGTSSLWPLREEKKEWQNNLGIRAWPNGEEVRTCNLLI